MSGIVGYINNTEVRQSSLLGRMSESIQYTESNRVGEWNDGIVL